MVNQQIFLPMIPDSAPIVINISQYDYDAAGYAGRLYFNLISNGTAYDMNGATALFQGEKPDGTTFAYAGTVVNSSVVRVNVRQQMTNVAGRVVCNLVLNNSEGQIGSFNVWLEIQESATSGSTPSQTDIPALVAQAKQYADDAQQSADDAASYTGHPAYIGANNNWFVYDIDTDAYVDSGVTALGQGIESITKTGTSGLVDTYTITYTGGATSTFNVTNGQGITSITKTATVGLVDTYTITFTDGSTTTYDVTNGEAPDITITAQVDGTSLVTPTVTVTEGGTITSPTYNFAFSGLKGTKGDTGDTGATGPAGNGIVSVSKIGTSGLVDTYRITYTNGSYFDYTVTNGQNGTGAGDMLQTDYDPTLAVYNAGGIVSYVSGQIPTPVQVVDNLNSTSSTSALSANQGHSINNPTITQASTRANIATGDTLATIWGKIKKWFADLGDLAFKNIDGSSSTKYLRGDGTWQTFPTIPTITDTYSSTSSNGMSGKAVNAALQTLDGSITGSAGTGKTLSAFSQTDGIVTAEFSNISITKSQVSDFPTIPTVNNGTLTIQKNGTQVATFTANQSGNATANIAVDYWSSTATVQSDSTVTFSGLNDSYGFELYCENKLIGISAITKTGSGTSTTLKYTVTGASTGDVCKLRILR